MNNIPSSFLSILLVLASAWSLQAQGSFQIIGEITVANGSELGQVSLTLTDANGNVVATDETDCDGSYQLTGLFADEAYVLHLEKEGNSLNGVSTFDRVLLSKHILGIDALDSPYNVYAADVNASGSITVTDILWIQSVVLANEETFPGGNWHFFQENDGQPSNDIPIQVTADVVGWNFIAVKKGDVNQSAILCE